MIACFCLSIVLFQKTVCSFFLFSWRLRISQLFFLYSSITSLCMLFISFPFLIPLYCIILNMYLYLLNFCTILSFVCLRKKQAYAYIYIHVQKKKQHQTFSSSVKLKDILVKLGIFEKRRLKWLGCLDCLIYLNISHEIWSMMVISTSTGVEFNFLLSTIIGLRGEQAIVERSSVVFPSLGDVLQHHIQSWLNHIHICMGAILQILLQLFKYAFIHNF